MSDDSNRFDYLLNEANKFCSFVGLSDRLIIDIFKAPSDWEFILKVDALLEAAAKHAVKASMRLKIGPDFIPVDDFVDTLPINGRTSLVSLLRVSGMGDEFCDAIQSVRMLRNAFAHDIRQIDESLVSVLLKRNDALSLLRKLMPIEKYDNDEVLEHIKKDGSYFRFCILDFVLRILLLVYHVTLVPKQPADESTAT
ncbi:hypothetical protein NKH37_11280 [Mesorhizobium sp. M1217]|uniref:hypothetical protein n=1 Tax=Mesorhizobium sp. M1217 TaxID=2957070 RepID=UPI00333D2660